MVERRRGAWPGESCGDEVCAGVAASDGGCESYLDLSEWPRDLCGRRGEVGAEASLPWNNERSDASPSGTSLSLSRCGFVDRFARVSVSPGFRPPLPGVRVEVLSGGSKSNDHRGLGAAAGACAVVALVK
jgi:hypothetical protein